MRTNYHTHTQRCRHAEGDVEDYVRAALAFGLSELGFSDHAPFPDIDFGMRMQFDELPWYIDEIQKVKEVYRQQIKIWLGLEIEYLPEYNYYYEKLLSKYGFDYLLMGEHFYKSKENTTKNIYHAAASEEYLYYANSVVQGMKTGYFKAIAHPDLFMVNPWPWDDMCEKAADTIIEAAVLTGTVLEYNANGFRRGLADYPDGKRYMYPYQRLWELAAAAKVLVAVGADSHKPSQLWDKEVEHAYNNLDKLKIPPVHHLFSDYR